MQTFAEAFCSPLPYHLAMPPHSAAKKATFSRDLGLFRTAEPILQGLWPSVKLHSPLFSLFSGSNTHYFVTQFELCAVPCFYRGFRGLAGARLVSSSCRRWSHVANYSGN